MLISASKLHRNYELWTGAVKLVFPREIVTAES
jgi:hypothetical protein